ncbi:Signal transduction histidine-protein kinase/phosphatase MprB [Corynebacterium auris]|nr:Signal transduction histidine-protein kinase/phosphatase MprB [Corynebacterium auris]
MTERGLHPAADPTLRTLVTILVGVLLVGAATVACYWVAQEAVEASTDDELETKACVLLEDIEEASGVEDMARNLTAFKRFNPDVRAAYVFPGNAAYIGDSVPVGGEFVRDDNGVETSVREVGGERVVVKRGPENSAVALAQSPDPEKHLLRGLGIIFVVVVGLALLLSWAVGELVARAAMRPIRRLEQAVEHVSNTEELRGITVEGDDELARLSSAFNGMMESLAESRRRQARLVVDAGHELKTPLTSMRTNIELLMMASRSGQFEQLPKEEKDALERDVIAQMDEMSALIGDLIDLAREDEPPRQTLPVRVDEVVREALERVKRRRLDVTFDAVLDPWVVHGDRHELARVPVNLLDNAAKWSPAGATVRLRLEAGRREAALTVDDSGPGIPAGERERVFERFYRSPEGRAMPGSGLGLAIAKHVVERHGGTIEAGESDDGGARFRVVLPGWEPAGANVAQ